jgi:hypothetical protein
MRLQPVVNRLILGLLRVPGLSAVIGKNLITVYAVGRKSGKRYAVPVAYTPDEGALLFGTPFGWGRNLRSGAPVQVRYKGALRSADVQVVRDEAGVIAEYATICRNNHNFAKFVKVALDDVGNPNPDDLRLAWQEGARAFRLTLR